MYNGRHRKNNLVTVGKECGCHRKNHHINERTLHVALSAFVGLKIDSLAGVPLAT